MADENKDMSERTLGERLNDQWAGHEAAKRTQVDFPPVKLPKDPGLSANQYVRQGGPKIEGYDAAKAAREAFEERKQRSLGANTRNPVQSIPAETVKEAPKTADPVSSRVLSREDQSPVEPKPDIVQELRGKLTSQPAVTAPPPGRFPGLGRLFKRR